MCIAILKPKGRQLKKKVLKTCFENNPDGSGFMFSDSGRLNIYKGFMNFSDFYKAYRLIDTTHKETLIHFRIKTHGAVSKENCHPFLVSNRLGFIHNGIIDIETKGSESDTMAFNRDYLKKINRLDLCIDDGGIQLLLEDRIGGSKLVFLDNKGQSTIVNEDRGIWKNDIWFSNDSFKSCNVYERFNFNSVSNYEVDSYNFGFEKDVLSCYDCGGALFEPFEIDNEICLECIKEDRYYKQIYENEKGV